MNPAVRSLTRPTKMPIDDNFTIPVVTSLSVYGIILVL